MSTEYYSNILYSDFFEEIKSTKIEIQTPDEPVFIIPHKRLHLNKNYIWIFKEDRDNCWIKNYTVLERTGFNDPTEIFNTILKLIHYSVILEEYSLMKWPECNQ
jgi:hypothetical protein